ncbi:MAG: alkaline phosphatase family protein [Candidatus Bathyarchaeia archaeon]
MRLLYIVIDGMGDLPIPELAGKTPLEAAETPNLDRLAEKGKLGLMYTVREGVAPESDVAVISILGYDPFTYYTGRGPLEAVGSNINFEDGDLALRCNFATADMNNKIIDRRVGRNLTTGEAEELSRTINSEVKLESVPSSFEFKSTIGHRAVLVIRKKGKGRLSGNITNTDPAYTRVGSLGSAEPEPETNLKMSKPMDETYEAKISAELLNEFTKKTRILLEDHPINLKRQSEGKLKANVILSRDAGSELPKLFNINRKYNLKFASIVEMPVERGISMLAGMSMIEIPPTGDLKHDSRIKAEKILQNIDHYDIFYIHLKGPDEPAHDGDYVSKKRTIEIIDSYFLGGILPNLSLQDTVICVTADHSTPCKLRRHTSDPVPLLVSGGRIKPDGLVKFSERECARGSLKIISEGSKLMPMLVSMLNLENS